MTNSFWVGGADAYARGIRKHYEAKFETLRERRLHVDDRERANIDAEIQHLEAEYRAKLKSTKDSLF